MSKENDFGGYGPHHAELPDHEHWFEKYKPVPNNIDPDGTYYGIDGVNYTWETYGAELVFVNSVDEEHVWTLIECDGIQEIHQGRLKVNRLAYFVCARGWNFGATTAYFYSNNDPYSEYHPDVERPNKTEYQFGDYNPVVAARNYSGRGGHETWGTQGI